MRQLPITLLHVVEEIVIGGPVGEMYFGHAQVAERQRPATSLISPARLLAPACEGLSHLRCTRKLFIPELYRH